jgi:hypothetical protein
VLYGVTKMSASRRGFLGGLIGSVGALIVGRKIDAAPTQDFQVDVAPRYVASGQHITLDLDPYHANWQEFYAGNIPDYIGTRK